MRFAVRSLVLVMLFAGVACAPGFATNLIVNGGFETGDFSGWTVTGNNTVVEGDGFSNYEPHGGTYFAALGNYGLPLGSVSQSFMDVSGQQYELTYYLASDGMDPNELETEVDGNVLSDLVNVPVTGSAPYPYVEYDFLFTGTGDDTLAFLDLDDPSFLALDDVSVAAVPAPIPEPGSMALFGTGILGVLGMVRRRGLRV